MLSFEKQIEIINERGLLYEDTGHCILSEQLGRCGLCVMSTDASLEVCWYGSSKQSDDKINAILNKYDTSRIKRLLRSL